VLRAVGIGLMLIMPIAPAAAAQSEGPRIGVDRRVELMAILFKLAGNRDFNQNNFRQYNAEIERHFGPFRDHEAVALSRTIYGDGFVGTLAARAVPDSLQD
jgi:hypothetical protein